MTLEEAVGPSHRLNAAPPRSFSLAGLAGQVVEISGWDRSAGSSLAASLIRECQDSGGLCAWISPRMEDGGSLFFPPDFQAGGIDCNRLPILWARSMEDGFSIAEKLMHSRGFRMLVIDLTAIRFPRTRGLGRLHRMARDSECLMLCLTRRRPGEASLDPMVFVHAHGASMAAEGGDYEVSVRIQKDKHHAPGRVLRRRYGPPPGLSRHT